VLPAQRDTQQRSICVLGAGLKSRDAAAVGLCLLQQSTVGHRRCV
jgi:hypothetical protein